MDKDERETIINWCEADTEASIFTYERKWQNHMEKKLGLKPVMNNGFGGKEYHLAKDRIRMPLAPRKLSAEQRQNIGRRLSQGRSKKSPNLSKTTHN